MAVERDRLEKRSSSACDRCKLDGFSASTILFRFVRRTELEQFLNIFFFDKELVRSLVGKEVTRIITRTNNELLRATQFRVYLRVISAQLRNEDRKGSPCEIDSTQRKAKLRDIDNFFDYVSSIDRYDASDIDIDLLRERQRQPRKPRCLFGR